MKKTFLIFGFFIVSAIGFSVYAMPTNFADGAKFESWYTDSVNRMSDLGVIKGYLDGTFKPENNVNRAELAVILDRFQQNADKNSPSASSGFISKTEMTEALSTLELKMENKFNIHSSSINNPQTENDIQRILLAYDEFSTLKLEKNLKVYLVMAEAGLKGLPTKPEMTDFTKVTDVQLPQGYTLYRHLDMGAYYYFNYVGPKSLGGDAVIQVNQWYGPFNAL